jgi:hypothetical protein
MYHLTGSHSYSSISRGTKIERGRRGPSFHFHFYLSFFFSEVSDSFSVSRSVFKLPHNHPLTHPSHLLLQCAAVCCSTIPSRCMEQCRMHSQQLTHNAHDAASFDILQSPFYPSFSDGSKVSQGPHSSHSYVQQQYAPDSGASLDGGGSPPLPYHILEQPQQAHPRHDPSPPPQQHQPYQIMAYPLFPHDHEGPYPTPQAFPHQLSLSAHSARMPISPWPIDAFSDNASAHPTTLRGGISPTYPSYTLRPQPLYRPSPTHRSVSTHAPPEQSQTTTIPGSSTLHEHREDRAMTEHGQRSRSWGGVGSLDPATGVFSRASDHPRIRTAQACEKCRARKAKVSIVPLSPSLVF